MAKAERIKASPHIVGSLTEAEEAMRELASLERRRQAIASKLNERVDELKNQAKAESACLEAQKKAIADALGTYLQMHRAEVLKDRKSVELTFGVMGFRASTSICQMRGVNAEMTLERLKDAGLLEGIRTKEELDKDIMRGWPDDRLAQVGLVRQEKDQFFVELKQEKLVETA